MTTVNRPTDTRLRHRSGDGDLEVKATPTVLIRPQQGWQLINVGELWQFRELLYFLAWRDVKVRYKQTLLGAAWAVLQPLLMMVVFTIFFGRMAGVPSGGLPYPLFAYAGLLPWTFFATAIAAAGNSVVGFGAADHQDLLPAAGGPVRGGRGGGRGFRDRLRPADGDDGLLPGAARPGHASAAGRSSLAILLAALGVGTLLAALNVAYRDFRYVIPFLVQLWMFATPRCTWKAAVRPPKRQRT